MKDYWIVLGSSVTDADAQQECGRLWTPIAAKYAPKDKVLDTGPPSLPRMFPDQRELKSKFTGATRRASPVPLLLDFLGDLKACAPHRER